MLIAAQALATQNVLITDNLSEFGRVMTQNIPRCSGHCRKCSLTHPDMPGGVLDGNPEPDYGEEFRITCWRLNPDYSMDNPGKAAAPHQL